MTDIETPQQAEELAQARSRGPVPDARIDWGTGPEVINGQSRDELHRDPNYVQFARIMFEAIEGRTTQTMEEDASGEMGMIGASSRDAPKTDEEMAAWLSNRYAWFNNNAGSLVVNWFRFNQMTETQALAFLYGRKMYNASDSNMETAKDVAAAVAADPLNWIGFGTMKGMSAFPKWVVKKQMDDILIRLQKKANRGAYGRAALQGTAEGTVHGGLLANAEQDLHTQAGKDYDWTEGAGNIAAEALTGGVATPAISGAVHLGSGIKQAIKR